MARRKKESLKDHVKYGKLFILIEKYGGGLEKWTEKNREISQVLKSMR